MKSSLEGCDDCSEVDDVFSKLAVEVRLSLACSDGSVDWGGPEKEREREKYKLSIHTKSELGEERERERERERRLTLIRISDGERDIESVENVGHVRGGHQLL